VHRDFHAQNLLWLPERVGVARVGILDFQDAVAGSRAQDLMHLLEDARRDVSPEVREAVIRRYVDATGIDEAPFLAETAVISGQRNARIAGIFARLAHRDGKPRYLDYIPRVWGHLENDLAHPAMQGLKDWYDRVIPPEKRRKG
jgi:aminoglycoside/choline kinase family phosphotransferase